MLVVAMAAWLHPSASGAAESEPHEVVRAHTFKVKGKTRKLEVGAQVSVIETRGARRKVRLHDGVVTWVPAIKLQRVRAPVPLVPTSPTASAPPPLTPPAPPSVEPPATAALVAAAAPATPVAPVTPTAPAAVTVVDASRLTAAAYSLPAAALTATVPHAPPGNVEAATTRRARRVAVYDLELEGIPANIGGVVTDSLLDEVRKLEGISAIGMAEIRDMLSHEANKQFLGCESNEACLAEIGGALGVDDLVTGKLSAAADSHVIVLRRIDQQRATVLGTVSRRLAPESGQEFLAAIGPAIEELFADRTLKPGVERGVAQQVALRLDPPPLPRWSFFAVAGGAAAAAVGGGVFAMLQRNAQSDYDAMAEQSRIDPLAGETLVAKGEAMDRYAGRAKVLWITTGVLAAASAVMGLFVDWHGYAAEEP
jgi:hypothetical protein